MAGFKYTLGINELSSKKHKLPSSLLAEFVGKCFHFICFATRTFISENSYFFSIYLKQ